MFEKKGKKGQVTIFIIIGIIIVAVALLIYSFYPKIRTTLGIEESTPQSYIQFCVEDKLRETVDILSKQGGSMNPELYILDGEKIEYLCYINEYYRPCVIQQPLLKKHIELELKNELENVVDECFNSLKRSYENKGYNVNMQTGIKKFELLPNRIVSTFDYPLTLSKGEVQRYDSFFVMLENNNLYELVAITSSILEWEATYGDADPRMYMVYYPELKVESISRRSGERIYILTHRESGDKFQFAVKSQVWPAGYALNTIIQ
jgi:hypothetical protein